MSPQIIALIIVAVTIVLFALETFSIATTAMLSTLAMVLTGILTSQQAFSCFTNSAVLLVIGIMIMLESLERAGVLNKIGDFLKRFTKYGEKKFLIVLFAIVAVCSMFVNNSPLVAALMPVVTAAMVSSGGAITKKNCFLPMAHAALIGGTGTLAGSTLPLMASEMLVEAGAKGLGFFGPLPVTLAVLAVVLICYYFFLYKLIRKWFDFDEVAEEGLAEAPAATDGAAPNKKNFTISLTVFVACVVLFVVQPFGWDIGLISIMGAIVLIVTGCLEGKEAIQKVNWSIIVVIGGTLGMAQGFVSSGAGEFIVNGIISLLGDAIYNPIVLLTVFMVIGNLLTQFMYNGSLSVMLCSLAIPLAQKIGYDPTPFAMGCFFASSFAMSLPSASVTVALTQTAGYRIKDYIRLGGATGLISLVAAWAAIILIYGLL